MSNVDFDDEAWPHDGRGEFAADERSLSEKGERKRRTFVEAAAAVFSDVGYQHSTIKDIAERADAWPGNIYYYFESKEDLLFEIIYRHHDGTRRILERCSSMAGDAKTVLDELLKLHIQELTADTVGASLFNIEFRSLGDERRKLIMERRDEYDSFVRNLVKRGQDEGLFCEDLDPKLASLAIVGMTQSIAAWYRPEGDSTPDEVGRAFRRVALRGLSCGPSCG